MSQQINLYNPLFRRQQTHFSLLAMLQGLAAILAAALLLYAYAAYQVAGLTKQTEQSAARLRVEQDRLAGAASGYSPQQANELLKNEVVQLEKKADEASRLVETLRSGVVGNTTGYSDYLRAFSRQAIPGLWLTHFKLNGTQISLSGGVISPELVPGYLQKLGGERVMQGKRFSNLQMQAAKDDKYLEFTLHSTDEDQP